MSQRQVRFAEPQDRFIENSVAAGRFHTVDEAVNEAVRLLAKQETEDREKLNWLDTAAQDAWDAFDRGEYTTLASEEEIHQYVRSAQRTAEETGTSPRG